MDKEELLNSIEKELHEIKAKEDVQRIINRAKIENIKYNKRETKYEKAIKIFFIIAIAILVMGIIIGIKNVMLGILITTISSVVLAIFGGIYAFLGEYD